jgi:predicted glycogen debranching enzyme
MDDWILRMPWPGVKAAASEPLLTREWLVTNGLGGYASGTIAGVVSRRYHGLLIAALPAPWGRRVMLNHLSELLRLPDETSAFLGGEERAGGILELPGAAYLTEFRLDMGLPVWRYELDATVIEKRVILLHRQNTVHVHYRLLAGPAPVRLKLRPSLHFRPHDASVEEPQCGSYAVTAVDQRYEVTANPPSPPLRLYLHGHRLAFTVENRQAADVFYRVEESRGYNFNGSLWSPGYFRADLALDQSVTLVASTEGWETILALGPEEAFAAERERRQHLLAAAHPAVRSGPAQELVLAADQFIITPAGRVEDAARARAAIGAGTP